MAEPQIDPDMLRPVALICEPDPRNTMLVRVDLSNGASRPFELIDHHEAISSLVLSEAVPKEIAVQFETAKNLYLYAWFVYRFFPVAVHQSLACLELALRTRLVEEIRTRKVDFKGKKPSLHHLLDFANKTSLIRNEGFSRWVEANDPEWNLAESLADTLPKMRNEYAHGSTTLFSSVLHILEVNCEIINQLLEPPHQAKVSL